MGSLSQSNHFSSFNNNETSSLKILTAIDPSIANFSVRVTIVRQKFSKKEMGQKQSTKKKRFAEHTVVVIPQFSDEDLTEFIIDLSKTVMLSQDYFYFNDKLTQEEINQRKSRSLNEDHAIEKSQLDIMKKYANRIITENPSYFSKTKYYEYQLRKGGVMREYDKNVIDKLTNELKMSPFLQRDVFMYKDITKEYESVLESSISAGMKYFWEYSFFAASYYPYFKDTSTILRIKVPKGTPCLWIEDNVYDFMFQKNSYLEYQNTQKMDLFDGENTVPMNIHNFYLHTK